MRKLGPEANKAQQRRAQSGFNDRYLSGDAVLDIGYRGRVPDAEPITGKAIGIELDYPGYDGKTLPFEDGSQDAVFVSHCLEHISDYTNALKDWYRVLKVGGFLIVAVPHQYLYEKKATLPSRFNTDHKRFYTPATLLLEVERSIPVDGYRVRSLSDIDEGFDYNISDRSHSKGSYEIELVIEKIARPEWGPRVSWGAIEILSAKRYAAIIIAYAAAVDDSRSQDGEALAAQLAMQPVSFILFKRYLPPDLLHRIRELLTPVIGRMPFDTQKYLSRHPDLATAFTTNPEGAHRHFINHGFFEGRSPD